MEICINNTYTHTHTHIQIKEQVKILKSVLKADHSIMNLFIWHGQDYCKRISGEYLQALNDSQTLYLEGFIYHQI